MFVRGLVTITPWGSVKHLLYKIKYCLGVLQYMLHYAITVITPLV